MPWTKRTAQVDTIIHYETVDGQALTVTIEATTTRGADRKPTMRLAPVGEYSRAQAAWFAATIPAAWETWGKEFH